MFLRLFGYWSFISGRVSGRFVPAHLQALHTRLYYDDNTREIGNEKR